MISQKQRSAFASSTKADHRDDVTEEMQPHTFCEEVETFLKTFAWYTTLRNFGIGEVSPSQRNDASQAETGPSAAIPNISAPDPTDPPPRHLSSTKWLHDGRSEVRSFSEQL